MTADQFINGWGGLEQWEGLLFLGGSITGAITFSLLFLLLKGR